MQQGWSAYLLLFVTACFSQGLVAKQLSQAEIDRWLDDEQVNQKAALLLSEFTKDRLDVLRFSLQRIALPQQEVVRFKLLQAIEKKQWIFDGQMMAFIEEQSRRSPTYQFRYQGNGYEYTVPAFDYPAVANRLLQQWKKNQQGLSFVLAAERGELDLEDWLSPRHPDYQSRRRLLLEHLSLLSPDAIASLAQQLTSMGVTRWLPSSELVMRLAQASGDRKVYDLLWKMRADQYGQMALRALAQRNTSFSQQQIMAAVSNPSLKPLALELLAKTQPLTPQVRQFLVEKMGDRNDAQALARTLVQQGHVDWLKEVINTNKQVDIAAIEDVLY
ncbi:MULTISPECIES: hypothetical protein [unclassified Vibrio]|uniref:HEAT repeat domain-containing protein n=1 Tax=Vibrio sp. HB236076 TaxID=3232307 RepID=A0AB39HGK2_9VIBR|nr:hypothetical protein [Vibrio sp. HB161653]MDP5255805.1 hypothetical protein [Vibrio sp. HB161653]